MSLSAIPFAVKLDEFIAPTGDASKLKGGLVLGSTTLSQNLSFLGEFFDFVAHSEPSLMSYREYQSRYRTKPIEPQNLDKATLQEAADFIKENPVSSSLPPSKALKTVALTLQQKRFEESKNLYQKLRQQYGDSLEDYAEYLLSILPASLSPFFNQPRSLRFAEESRMRHTLLTSGTGGGKSETLKILVHHYLEKNPETAVIVIDPHSDLAAC